MKKVLSLLLAMCMVLSLCSCKGKQEDDHNPAGSGSQNVTQTDPGKVDGDRIDVDNPGNNVDPNQGGTPSQSTSTEWKVGETVDPKSVLNTASMPLTTESMKMTMDAASFGMDEFDGVEGLNIIVYADKGQLNTIAFDIVTGSQHSTSTLFVDGDDAYVYLEAAGDTLFYKFSAAEAELSEITADLTEGFDLDAATDADAYNKLVYEGYANGADVFSATDIEGSSGKFYVDHETGYISGISLTSGEQTIVIELAWGADAASPFQTHDLSEAMEVDATTGVITFMMPMFSLMTEGGMTGGDTDIGDIATPNGDGEPVTPDANGEPVEP